MSNQFILMDLLGLELSPEEKELIADPAVAGVILFARNYESPTQLNSLTQAIRQVKIPIVIAADQEGGRVQRFKQGFTLLPPMSHWGEQYQINPLRAKQQLSATINTMSQELLACQVNVDLIPVLDINQANSQVIGERSFGNQAQTVIELAQTVISSLHKNNMPAIGKHFPGHGGVVADSHTDLPVDKREWNTLWQQDIQPFAKLAYQLDAMMPAHVVYQAVDPKPATFSPFWLQQVLREKLDFTGVVISDDLTMAGAASVGSYAERAGLALEAGCDLLSICNNREGVVEVIDALGRYQQPQSQQRVQKYLQQLV